MHQFLAAHYPQSLPGDTAMFFYTNIAVVIPHNCHSWTDSAKRSGSHDFLVNKLGKSYNCDVKLLCPQQKAVWTPLEVSNQQSTALMP